MSQDTTHTDCRAVTRATFAARWELSERYINGLIKDGVLPVVRLGRRAVRIPVQEADAALLKYTSGKGVA